MALNLARGLMLTCRAMQGAKAFILPGIGAAVLGLLLLVRLNTNSAPPEPDSEQAEGASKDATKGSPEANALLGRIRAAVAKVGPSQALPAQYSRVVETALRQLVQRCRWGRTGEAPSAITLGVKVIAASNLGGAVVQATPVGDISPGMIGCLRHGAGGLKLDAPASTGSAALNFTFAPPKPS